MVFKTIPLTFYPTALRSNYNATITDYRQTNVTSSALNATVYLYDKDKTPVLAANPVTIKMTRINASGATIRGYKYISNDVITKKALTAAASNTLKITDLRDPGAKIIFFGGGTGTIKFTNTSKSYSVSGKTIKAGVTFSINKTSFEYPTSSNVAVTVTPTYSGTNVDAVKDWEVSWNAKFSGGAELVSISGNQKNSGSGTLTFKRTYDKETTGTPTVTIILERLRAYYSFSASGTKVKYAIVKDGGASGYENADGSGTGYWVPGGTETEVDGNYDETYGMYYFTWTASWGEEVTAWVYRDNVNIVERENPGDTVSGEIGYDDGYDWYLEKYE